MKLTAAELALVRIPTVKTGPNFSTLGHTTKSVLWHLWAINGDWTDCQQMSELIGCSDTSVTSALRALRKLGLIWSLREGRSGGYRPNRHTLREAAIRKLMAPAPPLHLEKLKSARKAAVDALAAEALALAAKIEWERALPEGSLMRICSPGKHRTGKGLIKTKPVVAARAELCQLLLLKRGATTGLVCEATGFSRDYVRPIRRAMRKHKQMGVAA